MTNASANQLDLVIETVPIAAIKDNALNPRKQGLGSNQAHWLEPLRHELTFFPRGKYDDQADALSQGLLWLSQAGGRANFLRLTTEINGQRGLE